MPLVYKNQINTSTVVGVWDIQEEPQFFIEELGLSQEEESMLKDMRNHRLIEWLSSRYLCHQLSGHKNRIEIIKDKFGKPFLKGSKKYISLSHSKDKSAVIISSQKVGIDIQKYEIKISKIQHKFISEKERCYLDQEQLETAYHIFWGSKESMYKAYGKKELGFKEHMYLYPFKIFQSELELKGWVHKNNFNQDYNIFVNKLDDFFLIYAIPENEN